MTIDPFLNIGTIIIRVDDSMQFHDFAYLHIQLIVGS